jgi:hypothetical protein
MNVENKEAKVKSHQIWGWVSAIVGGLLLFIGIYNLLILSFGESPDWVVEIIKCTVPGLLLGVLLLIFGIRRIKAVSAIQAVDSVILEVRVRRRRIWGWILAIIGGVIILCAIGLLFFGYYAYFILPPLQGNIEPYEGYSLESYIFFMVELTLPVLVIGISLLIPSYIMLRKKDISRQSRGWILIIVGGVYLVATIISIGYSMINPINYSDIVISTICWSPFLILGILSLVFGIIDIRHKEKTPPKIIVV